MTTRRGCRGVKFFLAVQYVAVIILILIPNSYAQDLLLLDELKKTVYQRLDDYNEANEREDLDALLRFVNTDSEWYKRGYEESLQGEFKFFDSIGIITRNREIRWTQYGLQKQPGKALIEEDVVWWGYPAGSNMPIINEYHVIRELVENGDGWKLSRLETESSEEGIYISKGVISLGQERVEEARTQFKHALAITSNSGRALGYLGLSYAFFGNREVASQYLLRAVEANSSLMPFWYILAIQYAELGDYEKGAKVLERSISRSPRNKWSRWYLGQYYLETKDYEGALQAFETIRVMFPDSPIGFFGKGLVFEVQRKTEQAIEAFQQVCKIAPFSNYTNDAKKHLDILSKGK